MSDINARYVPTIRHIPKELHPLWARCVSWAVANTVFHNSVEKWRDLHMLAKCVLCNPPRAGKKHTSQRVSFTRARLNRWLGGERMSLWRDIPTYTPPRQKKTSAEGNKRSRDHRCIEHCAEGGYSAACKALTKEPPLAHTSPFHRQLKDKHPPTHRPPSLAQLLNTRWGSS